MVEPCRKCIVGPSWWHLYPNFWIFLKNSSFSVTFTIILLLLLLNFKALMSKSQSVLKPASILAVSAFFPHCVLYFAISSSVNMLSLKKEPISSTFYILLPMFSSPILETFIHLSLSPSLLLSLSTNITYIYIHIHIYVCMYLFICGHIYILTYT